MKVLTLDELIRALAGDARHPHQDAVDEGRANAVSVFIAERRDEFNEYARRVHLPVLIESINDAAQRAIHAYPMLHDAIMKEAHAICESLEKGIVLSEQVAKYRLEEWENIKAKRPPHKHVHSDDSDHNSDRPTI